MSNATIRAIVPICPTCFTADEDTRDTCETGDGTPPFHCYYCGDECSSHASVLVTDPEEIYVFKEALCIFFLLLGFVIGCLVSWN